MHVHMHLNYIPADSQKTNKQTAPLAGGVDLLKQWILFKEFLPRKLLHPTCNPTSPISATTFSLGIKAMFCPS